MPLPLNPHPFNPNLRTPDNTTRRCRRRLIQKNTGSKDDFLAAWGGSCVGFGGPGCFIGGCGVGFCWVLSWFLEVVGGFWGGLGRCLVAFKWIWVANPHNTPHTPQKSPPSKTQNAPNPPGKNQTTPNHAQNYPNAADIHIPEYPGRSKKILEIP